MGGTGGKAIESAKDEGATELCLAVVAGQVWTLHVEQLRRADHHGDTLTGIAETLRAGNHDDVEIGVLGYSGLERSLTGNAVVLAEVHKEVGGVLHNNDTVFVGHLADNLQLVVGEAEPCGVIGATENHAGHVAILEFLFQFSTQSITTVFIDVESLHRDAEYAALLLLHGEAGVDKKHLGLLGIVTGEGKERSKSSLHRTHSRHTAVGRHVDVEEILHETGCLAFEVGGTIYFWVDAGHAVL